MQTGLYDILDFVLLDILILTNYVTLHTLQIIIKTYIGKCYVLKGLTRSELFSSTKVHLFFSKLADSGC